MEIHPLPGKGNAALASHFIKSGTIIFEETPILTWIPQTYTIINQLSIVLSSPSLMTQMSSMSPLNTMFLSKSRYEQLSALVNPLCDKISVDTGVLYYLRLETNAFPCGVCPVIAKANHSCLPNSKVEEHDSEGVVYKLIATRNILPGEEITVSYLEKPELMSRKERIRHLCNQYYFDCSCELCELGEVFKCNSKSAYEGAESSDGCRGKVSSSKKECNKCGKVFSEKEVSKIEDSIDEVLISLRNSKDSGRDEKHKILKKIFKLLHSQPELFC